MKISGMGNVNAQAGYGGVQATDAQSKNLLNQIANAQKKLQELSADEKLSVEEKMKKRQEIQKQINDLNNQLRQHQIELRREAQQEKSEPKEDIFSGSQKAGEERGKGTGISKAGMEAMISADTAIGQANVQGSVATKLEGRAGVLETEIKLDAARGGSVTSKQEELESIKQKAAAAVASQGETLKEAGEKLRESAEREEETLNKKTEEEQEEDENTVGQTYTNEAKIVRESEDPTVSVRI